MLNKPKPISTYTKFLVFLFFASSVLSFFQSRTVYKLPKEGQVAGAVTVSASVPENPYSSAAQQIVNKQKELDEKEKLLATKEQQLNQDREKETRRMIYLYIIAGSIFFLLLMNYYLDYRRSKRQGPPSNLNPSLKAS